MSRVMISYDLDMERVRSRQRGAKKLLFTKNPHHVDAGRRPMVVFNAENFRLRIRGPEVDLTIEDVEAFRVTVME